MKCSICKKDKCYWDLQPFPIKDCDGNIIRPRKTYLVCPKCLGWNTYQHTVKF